MYFTFAWRYFKAKKSANAINIIAWITVGVIAFATCCQVLVLSVFNGFEGLVKSLYATVYADIKIVPALGKTFTITEEQLAQIKKQPGVINYSMIAEEKALLNNHENTKPVYLKGVDENYEQVAGIAANIIRGKYFLGTTQDPYLVCGTGIQQATNINFDPAFGVNELTIILPRRNDQNNDPIQSLSEGFIKASGSFAIQQEFDDKYVITNIGFVKQQMGFAPHEYSSVEIKTSQESNATAIKKSISTILGDSYKVLTKYEQNTTLYNTMKMEKWVIYSLFTLILIVSAFTMISALTMLVLEKRKDISVLQSMGAKQQTILSIFLSEGFLLGCIGTFIGITLAMILCLLQIKLKLIKMSGATFLIDYFPVKLFLSDFLLVVATALTIALIAAFFPAFKASRQPIELR